MNELNPVFEAVEQVKVVQLTPTIVAARWLNQQAATWPEWWRGVVSTDSPLEPDGALLLYGNQLRSVKPGDWLFRRGEGPVRVLSDADFREQFREVEG